MNEQEWLECEDPRAMLEFQQGKASERKLRLFACGFCNIVDEVIADEDCRNAVHIAERFADGGAYPEELKAACQSARLVWAASEWKGMLVANATESKGWAAASGVQSALEMDDIPRKFWRLQSDLIRDIFGNPFHLIPPTPDWLARNEGAVRQIAQTIYDERAFDRMPILADALTDAGCDNADILNHCRSEGPHVKGCWVVDALLGKE